LRSARLRLWQAGVGLLGIGFVTYIAQSAAPRHEEPAFGFNLLSNSSFENDWYNTRPEIMSCPVEARVRFGQTDGIVDGWKGAADAQRTRDAHSGEYAVRIPAGKSLTTDPTGYAVTTKDSTRVAPLRLSAWVKGGAGNLTVTLTSGQKEVGEVLKKSQDFPAAANWTRVTFDIPAADVEAAVKAKPQVAGAIQATAAVSATAGDVTVDDVRLERPYLPSPYTLVANPGFETVEKNGTPSFWSQVRKSMRHVGGWYYVWRSWYHPLTVPRGASDVDNMVVAAGSHSFRMNVPPGDEKYIESDPITLNQTGPQRMAIRFDYNSYMLANLIVQVLDDQGHEVFFDYIEPGTTGGWQSYQRDFTPAEIKPHAANPAGSNANSDVGPAVAVKSCKVRIAVRGVNGSAQDDINEWVNVNHAGILWFDNVSLMEVEHSAAELRARGAKVYNVDQTPAPLVVESIDLGERLYGRNNATVTVLNTGSKEATANLTMNISGPYRESNPQKADYAMGAVDQDVLLPQPKRGPDQKQSVPVQVGAGYRGTVTIPYNIDQLTDDWSSEYRVDVGLNANQKTHLTFGTWSQEVMVDNLKSYLYPNETTQTVSMNLGVAHDTLRQTKTVRLEVRDAANNKAVSTQEIADWPQKAAQFNLEQLPKDWLGDDTNFLQTTFDVSKLPIHPQTEPVRDHYVYVQGLDAAGKETFHGASPRFGRMEEHNEKLEPIKTISISKDNYLLINGKPFFNRGHLQMQQNFGPSPESHQNMDFKKSGFNTADNGQRANDSQHSPDDYWVKQNLYCISRRIGGKPPLTDKDKEEITKLVNHPGVIGINYIDWEGAPEGGTDQERLDYVKQIKALLNGHPLWLSAGWYSPTVDGIIYPDYLQHDFFAPESTSYLQPSQLDREVLPKKAALGQNCVLNTFDNVFNDLPWDVQRFEHFTDIIHGHTGYTIIGIPGDPTLDRGMNGEIRFIEKFLFNKDKTPDVTVAPNVEHMVRANQGKTYIMATNAGPVIGGDWRWNKQLKDQGVASHTGDAMWSRYYPFMKDYHNHFYKYDRPVQVHNGDKIVQYVYIPTGAKVDSVTLMVRGNGDWMYQAVWGKWDEKDFTDSGARLWMAKDMHQMFWGTLGFGASDNNNPHNARLVAKIFTDEQFHRMGDLPAAGKWVRLEVPVEKLGLDGQLVDGFGWLSKGANVWWERTLLVQNGKETVLCDGSAGIDPAKLKAVRFNVPGLKAGTKIHDVFDDREITAQDGYFEDDLTGEPGYRNLWTGIYGDKVGEDGYYGDGIFYNYNFGRIAAKVYEIPPLQ
jgi:hypothetical protein